jgi:hypothetical protein
MPSSTADRPISISVRRGGAASKTIAKAELIDDLIDVRRIESSASLRAIDEEKYDSGESFADGITEDCDEPEVPCELAEYAAQEVLAPEPFARADLEGGGGGGLGSGYSSLKKDLSSNVRAILTGEIALGRESVSREPAPELEPRLILTESDEEIGLAESADELVLEDSTTDDRYDMGAIADDPDPFAMNGPASPPRDSGVIGGLVGGAGSGLVASGYRAPPGMPQPPPPPSFGGFSADPFAGDPYSSPSFGALPSASFGSDPFAPPPSAFDPFSSGFMPPPTGATTPAPANRMTAGRAAPFQASLSAGPGGPPSGMPVPAPQPALPMPSSSMTRSKGGLSPIGAMLDIAGAVQGLGEGLLEGRRRSEAKDRVRSVDEKSKKRLADREDRSEMAQERDRRADEAPMAKLEEAKPAAPAKPKPAEAAPRTEAPKMRQIEIEEIERRTTVRHYKQMYLQTIYPLAVIISQHKIKKLISVLVDQVSSKKAFKVKASNPIVHIRPIIPGCLCVPAATDLDVTEAVATAQFHVTPQALGDLEGARVEIIYEGKLVDSIDLKMVATTQALAKLSGSAAFVTTTLGPAFKAFGERLSDEGASWLGELLTVAGSKNGPLISSALLGLLTLIFYLRHKPSEAPPVEALFDYEAAQEPPGDKGVMAQKRRLVLLSRTRRESFEIMERSTVIGREASCLITLTERSLANRHCELRFNPDAMSFSVLPIEGEVEIDEVAVKDSQVLGREAVIGLSGEVALWFYDARSDERLDNPPTRSRVESALIETLGSFESKIREAFRDPRNTTVRSCLAALMVAGILSPRKWLLIARAKKLLG